MAYYRPKKGERDGTPIITVPRTLTQCTYFNVPLAVLLQSKGIERIKLEVDTDSKEILVKEAKEGEKGYKVLKTGLRGFGISPKLRKVLPAGKYRLSSGRKLLFSRA